MGVQTKIPQSVVLLASCHRFLPVHFAVLSQFSARCVAALQPQSVCLKLFTFPCWMTCNKCGGVDEGEVEVKRILASVFRWLMKMICTSRVSEAATEGSHVSPFEAVTLDWKD